MFELYKCDGILSFYILGSWAQPGILQAAFFWFRTRLSNRLCAEDGMVRALLGE